MQEVIDQLALDTPILLLAVEQKKLKSGFACC
jgi:hypothetical protein